MTLDEAIAHCDDVARSGCSACAAEHAQLADWLRQLRDLGTGPSRTETRAEVPELRGPAKEDET